MKKWLVEVEWYDISSLTNESRYAKIEPIKCHTYGILWDNYICNVPYVRILTTMVVSSSMSDYDTDDIVNIPCGCIKNIRKIEPITIHNVETVTLKKMNIGKKGDSNG